MLSAYFESFEQFMRTGDTGHLADYLESGSNQTILNVYRNGYLKTCSDALVSSFPSVESLVGENYFRQLAHSYIEVHPPGKGTLVGYGHQFPEFLQTRLHDHSLSYLADTAVLDAAWMASFFARNERVLDADGIEAMNAQGGDVSDLRASLAPSTRLVDLHYDLLETWALIREQGALKHDVSVSPLEHQVLFWRLDGQILFRALQVGESAFLSAFATTTTLGAAAEKALEADENFDIANSFAALLDNKILRTEGDEQ